MEKRIIYWRKITHFASVEELDESMETWGYTLRSTQYDSYFQVWIRITIYLRSIFFSWMHSFSPIYGTMNKDEYIDILKQYLLPFKRIVHGSNAEFAYQ